MTITGVKNILKSKINSLDDYNSYSLKADYHRKIIKEKSKNILNRLKRLKVMAKTHIKVGWSLKVILIVNLYITQNLQKVKKLKIN